MRDARLRQDRAGLRRPGPADGQARHAGGDRRATVAALKVPRFDVWVPRAPRPRSSWLGAILPRAWREAVSRGDELQTASCATDRSRARGLRGARRGAPPRAADEVMLEEAHGGLSRRSQSAMSAPISGRPGPPGGSGRRPSITWAPGGRARRRTPRPPPAAAAGPAAPHSISGGRVSSRSAASTRGPRSAPGSSGVSGRIAGNARAPALLASLGNGAS